MQIYSQLAPLALGGAHGSAVAMGFFDGIHIGHRAVINGAVEWARAHGAAPAVFTFRLPTENKMKGKRLLSTEDKHALIASLGVEHYLCPDFEEIKAMTPEQFVLGIIRDCNARALFCGENFTFGARAAGTPELLRQLCEPLGVEVVVLPMAQFEEKPVSSTRIRTALEGGDIPAANAMLGMPYAIRFTVQHAAAAYLFQCLGYKGKSNIKEQRAGTICGTCPLFSITYADPELRSEHGNARCPSSGGRPADCGGGQPFSSDHGGCGDR